MQRQPVVVGVGEAAAAFDDVQLRVRVHAERRELAPLAPARWPARDRCPRRLRRRRRAARRWRRSSRFLRAATCRRRSRAAQSVPATPVPRAHSVISWLPARTCTRSVPSRSRRAGRPPVETQRREAVGQHPRQQFFARIAGHVEADARHVDRPGSRPGPAGRPALPSRPPARRCGACRATRRRRDAPAARRANRRRTDRRWRWRPAASAPRGASSTRSARRRVAAGREAQRSGRRSRRRPRPARR